MSDPTTDPTTEDQPDVLEQPDATVPAGGSDKEPIEADWRLTEPDDTLGVRDPGGDPTDETTPVANLE